MTDPKLIIFAVGLAHVAALVYLWYNGLARRFPWLAVHLGVEAIFQLAKMALPAEWNAILVIGGRAPGLALRFLVAREVTQAVTRRGFDPRERVGLWFGAGIFVALCGVGSIIPLALTEGQRIKNLYGVLLFVRQYVLMGLAAWLVAINGYMLLSRTTTDRNLTLYRGWATISAITVFWGSAFVAGGLGYRLMPWTRDTWLQVHDWRSWCAVILIGILALAVRHDEPEME